MSQRLNSYFAASPELRKLTQKAQQLSALQRSYQQAAPSTLTHSSRVIGFEQHILTLGADNSAIAAKLRQLTPQILGLLQENGAEVTGILVKVQVSQPPVALDQTDHSLGEIGRQQIINLADTIPDSPLKYALQRLLKR